VGRFCLEACLSLLLGRRHFLFDKLDVLALFAGLFVDGPGVEFVHFKLVLRARIALRVVTVSCAGFALEADFLRLSLFLAMV
jgi:hypothetical protein